MRTLLCITTLLLGACASTPPIALPTTIEIPPQAVRDNATDYVGQTARWGGRILSTENNANGTVLILVTYPLDYGGRPRPQEINTGRILVRKAEFIDPAIYARGREVTVTGAIEGVERRTVNEYSYPYVVVKADSIYLWPIIVPRYNDWTNEDWLFDTFCMKC